MNDFHGILALQVETLLGALRKQREIRCRQIIRDAEKEQRELLRSSRRQLRDRVHQAVVEERRRRETALLEARHRIQTAKRRNKQAQYVELLQRAWPQLLAELERRWSDTECRAEWCNMLLTEAAQTLPVNSWKIVHGSSWSADDSIRLMQSVSDRGLPKPSLCAEPEFSAGLKIYCDSACLDGTLKGLLVNGERVQAQFLAAWERELSNAMEPPHD